MIIAPVLCLSEWIIHYNHHLLGGNYLLVLFQCDALRFCDFLLFFLVFGDSIRSDAQLDATFPLFVFACQNLLSGTLLCGCGNILFMNLITIAVHTRSDELTIGRRTVKCGCGQWRAAALHFIFLFFSFCASFIRQLHSAATWYTFFCLFFHSTITTYWFLISFVLRLCLCLSFLFLSHFRLFDTGDMKCFFNFSWSIWQTEKFFLHLQLSFSLNILLDQFCSFDISHSVVW